MEKLNKIRSDFEDKIANVKNAQELKDIRNEFLSKNGSITALMQNLKDLSIEEKKTFGSEVNKLKNSYIAFETKVIKNSLPYIKRAGYYNVRL